MEEAGVAKVTPRERRVTAIVAALVFFLFAFATLQFHDAAAIASKDLGRSVWTETAATTARLTPVIDAIVHETAVAGWLVKGMDTSRLQFDDSPDEASKTWEAAKDVGEALSDDSARERLVSRWTQEMRSQTRLAAAQPLVQAHLRDGNAPRHLDDLVDEYYKGLQAAVTGWIDNELPAGALVGILRANEIAIKPSTGNKAGGAGTVAAEDDSVPQFTSDLQQSLAQFLQSDPVREEIRAAWERDLAVGSAQEPLVKAIERDYSGRWMWAIAAAIFVTAAVSAILGGAWRTYVLAGPGQRLWPFLAYVAAVAIGIAAAFTTVRSMPTFLSDPLTQFTAFYQVGIQVAASIVKGVTVAAVCALMVACWSSFLLKTESVDHLEQQLATLRWSFHSATFVLVAGVLHVYAFYQWPSAFMSEEAAAAIQSGARVFALALGAVFSTLLLLMYVPGAKVLVAEARARQASADDSVVTRIENMLKEHGFDAAPSQQIVRFAQLFAPLLIAPLGAELVGLLGE